MRIQVQEMGGALVVRPEGELTEDTARDLLEEIGRELGEACDVILDLSDVDRVAVGALPVLFRIQQLAREGDGVMYVAGAGDAARRLFDLTRVSENLRLVSSAEEVLAVRV